MRAGDYYKHNQRWEIVKLLMPNVTHLDLGKMVVYRTENLLEGTIRLFCLSKQSFEKIYSPAEWDEKKREFK